MQFNSRLSFSIHSILFFKPFDNFGESRIWTINSIDVEPIWLLALTVYMPVWIDGFGLEIIRLYLFFSTSLSYLTPSLTDNSLSFINL